MLDECEIIEESAANNVPSFLLGFSTDTGPAVFLISQQILGAFNISDNVGSLAFEGSSTGFDSHCNVSGAFYFQCLGALCVKNGWHFHLDRLLRLNFGDRLIDGEQEGGSNNGGQDDGESFGH